jgi:hypothetical protein
MKSSEKRSRMSTPTLDRLNLEEVLGIADWDPELPCEAHKVGITDPITRRKRHTNEHCPNRATLVIVIHTRKCWTVLSCAECYGKIREMIKNTRSDDPAKGRCGKCSGVFTFAEDMWSEPI